MQREVDAKELASLIRAAINGRHSERSEESQE